MNFAQAGEISLEWASQLPHFFHPCSSTQTVGYLENAALEASCEEQLPWGVAALNTGKIPLTEHCSSASRIWTWLIWRWAGHVQFKDTRSPWHSVVFIDWTKGRTAKNMCWPKCGLVAYKQTDNWMFTKEDNWFVSSTASRCFYQGVLKKVQGYGGSTFSIQSLNIPSTYPVFQACPSLDQAGTGTQGHSLSTIATEQSIVYLHKIEEITTTNCNKSIILDCSITPASKIKLWTQCLQPAPSENESQA